MSLGVRGITHHLERWQMETSQRTVSQSKKATHAWRRGCPDHRDSGGEARARAFRAPKPASGLGPHGASACRAAVRPVRPEHKVHNATPAQSRAVSRGPSAWTGADRAGPSAVPQGGRHVTRQGGRVPTGADGLGGAGPRGPQLTPSQTEARPLPSHTAGGATIVGPVQRLQERDEWGGPGDSCSDTVHAVCQTRGCSGGWSPVPVGDQWPAGTDG